MKTAFILLALLLTGFALVIVIVPMLRSGRRHGHPRHALAVSLAVAFLLPLTALALYMKVGTPAALVPANLQRPTTQQMLDQLRAHLADKPDDLKGWLLLAQVYQAMDKPGPARDAYGKALKLAPDNTDLMVAWAETDAQARPEHLISDRGRSLLQAAIGKSPKDQRGLWLLGISDYQHGQFANASRLWRRLEAQLQPGTPVAQAVKRQIAMADARAAGKSQQEAMALLQSPSTPSTGTPAPATSSSTTDHAEGVHLAVHVTVAPSLRSRVRPGDTVFVFARNANGSPMPLAVARLKASELPTTVMLTDGMGMTPQARLSDARRVTVIARISRSGQALPAAGDLQGQSGPLAVQDGKTVDIVIGHVR